VRGHPAIDHSYNTPKEGTTDWQEPLNENVEDFDTDVEIRDIAANRSDYEPKEDANTSRQIPERCHWATATFGSTSGHCPIPTNRETGRSSLSRARSRARSGTASSPCG
jgi:hypothetical protein